MGTLTAELFISVDGWAGSDNLPGYFGYLGPELEKWMSAKSASPFVAVMGRTTYEMLNGLPDEAKDAQYEKMVSRETVVFSRTLTSLDWPNARISDNLSGEIQRLKSESSVELRTVGSPSLVRQLLDASLVDNLLLATFPLFAGSAGREWAFTDMASADLELVGLETLDDRVLVTTYHPTGNDIPRG